jgi:hypothetical protein
LIDALATQIWEIDKLHGVLKVFEGTYSDYHARREPEAAEDSVPDDARREKREAFRKARTAKNREIALERRRLARLAEVQTQIAALEAKLTKLGGILANPPSDRAEIQRAGEEYMRAELELEPLLEELEKLQE